jgi:tetratricopeptide (TPR) repeat protein
MDRKNRIILAAVVGLIVVKGPVIRDRVLTWYEKKSGVLTDAGPKVGLGSELLPSLNFDVIPGDCSVFFKSVLKLDLGNYRREGFTLTHEALPMLVQGCVIPTEPYFSAVNRYVRECLGEQTESKEVIEGPCVRAVMNLRAAVVDQLFPEPRFSEISDEKLLANLAFAAFVKLDAHELEGAALRLQHLKPKSYTAAKWYAFAVVINTIESNGDESRAKKAIEAARDLYDQDAALEGLEVFLASRGFKNQNGMVKATEMLNHFPRNAEAKAWAGYYQWMVGNRETALSLYREAAAIEPKKKEYQNAIQVLQDNSPEDDMIRGKFFPVTWNREDLK